MMRKILLLVLVFSVLLAGCGSPETEGTATPMDEEPAGGDEGAGNDTGGDTGGNDTGGDTGDTGGNETGNETGNESG